MSEEYVSGSYERQMFHKCLFGNDNFQKHVTVSSFFKCWPMSSKYSLSVEIELKAQHGHLNDNTSFGVTVSQDEWFLDKWDCILPHI